MLRTIKHTIYYMVFPIYKSLKYPSCKIYAKHIHPSVSLGRYVVIEKHCKIDRNIKISDFTYINEYTRIDANTSSIGKYCSISHNVKIGMGPHPLNFVSTSPFLYLKRNNIVEKDLFDEYREKGYTTIEHDVLIGANSIILAGVKIGTGAVVGAGSIVTKDVKPYHIVAGNPAKVIGKRFDDKTIEQLLLSQWWDMKISDLPSINNIKKFLEGLEKNVSR